MKQPKAKPAALAVIKPVKVPVLKSGDDKEVAAKFMAMFQDAQNGMRRVVAFGIFAEQVKLTKLKHGQFGPWVAANCPSLSYRSVRAHMQLAESALEAVGFKSLKGFLNKCAPFQNGSVCHFDHAGDLLLLPEKSLPEAAIEMRAKICELIDGKTARQLFVEFKQAEEDGEGNLNVKRGRRRGQGGASAAQRAKAKAKDEDAEALAQNLWAEEAAEVIREQCDDAHWGKRLSDENAEKLLAAMQLGVDYLKRLNKLRSSPQRRGDAEGEYL